MNSATINSQLLDTFNSLSEEDKEIILVGNGVTELEGLTNRFEERFPNLNSSELPEKLFSFLTAYKNSTTSSAYKDTNDHDKTPDYSRSR